MIAIDQLTEEQFERHALDVLKRELGPRWPGPVFAAELSDTGDYTRDRELWQKDLTLDEIQESIRKHRLH